jgi:hypothetical protein
VQRLKSTIKPQRGAFPLAAKATLAGTTLAAPVSAIAPAPLSTWRLVKDFFSLILYLLCSFIFCLRLLAFFDVNDNILKTDHGRIQ